MRFARAADPTWMDRLTRAAADPGVRAAVADLAAAAGRLSGDEPAAEPAEEAEPAPPPEPARPKLAVAPPPVPAPPVPASPEPPPARTAPRFAGGRSNRG